MRRVQFGLLTFALPALALSLVLAGCGGKDDKGGDTKKPGETKKNPKPTPTGDKKEVKGDGISTIKGAIKLDASPNIAELDKKIKDLINESDSKSVCLMGSAHEKDQQVWRIGENKQVANVFVWIQPEDANHYFPISDQQIEHAKDHPAEIDQPYCAFVPHCVVLFQKYYDPKTKQPAKTGQKFIVKNSAKINHNTKWESASSSDSKLIPAGDQLIVPPSDKGEVFQPSNKPIRLNCDIHKWMDAVALATDNPYSAISLGPDKKVKAGDPKYGTFEIKGVPAGVKVRIFAWHEKAGYLNENAAKGQVIQVKDKETPIDFTIKSIE